MGILDNNTKKMPVKIRIETVPVEKRTQAVDGCVVINRPRPKPAAKEPEKPQVEEAPVLMKKPTQGAGPIIGEEDWAEWVGFFEQIKDEYKIDYVSKAHLERGMAATKNFDGWKHWEHSLRQRNGDYLRITFAVIEEPKPRFLLLACYYSDDTHSCMATRTSLAHSLRTECSGWTVYSAPDRQIEPCCSGLCQDVPEHGEISRYEQSLRLEKRDWELKELKKQMKARVKAIQQTRLGDLPATKNMRNEIASLKSEVKRLASTNTRLADTSVELSAENSQLREEVDHLNNEMVMQCDEWADIRARSSERIKSLKARLERSNKQLATAEKQSMKRKRVEIVDSGLESDSSGSKRTRSF